MLLFYITTHLLPINIGLMVSKPEGLYRTYYRIRGLCGRKHVTCLLYQAQAEISLEVLVQYSVTLDNILRLSLYVLSMVLRHTFWLIHVPLWCKLPVCSNTVKFYQYRSNKIFINQIQQYTCNDRSFVKHYEGLHFLQFKTPL